MTRLDVVKKVAFSMDITAVKADELVRVVFGSVTECLVEGENVTIKGFGRLFIQHKAERIGRNPKNQQPAVISARKRVAFKASKGLKETVNC